MPNKSIYLSIFQQIIESIPDIALIVDKNGIITALNSQIKTHLGYNPAELIGKLVTDLPFFTDSSKVIAVDYFQKRMAGEIIEPYELELKSKDGNFKSGLIHAQKISDPGVELEIDFIVVEMQLVENPSDKPNEFESTKKALEESEARYKFLVNSSDEYILIVSYTGKILFANRATVTNFGFSEEEIIGKPITSFLAPNSASKVGPAILQAFLGKNPGKFDIYTRTKAGGYRIIENNSKSLTFINHGNTKGLLIFGRDVTEQRQAESKIEKSENRFQALFQHTPIAYLMFDQDGKITDANPPSLTLLSTTLSDIKNKTIEELALFDSDAITKIKSSFSEALSDNGLKTIEIEGKSAEGQTTLFGIDIYKLTFDNNDSIVVSLRDITQQKKFEVEILKKNDELERINSLMVGREIKMLELKKEIELLKSKIQKLDNPQK